MSVDVFTVPTGLFLYVFWFWLTTEGGIDFGVTAHPTVEWTAQQLRDAFPWDTAPVYLVRDRDRIFGDEFTGQVEDMGIQEVLSAPRSPWQRAYIEGPVGTLRREEPPPVHPPELGAVVAIPQVGGLHQRYQRRAA